MRSFRREMAVLLGLLVARPSMPQTPSANDPVFRVTTRLILVNAVVHDKDGRPVADLKQEDFIVTERGKPQTISFFSVDVQAATAKPTLTLPQNVFTNRLEYRPAAPTSVSIILMDSLNTALADQAYAKAQLLKYLEQMRPTDRVALYHLGTSLRIVHDFTNDSSRLIQAVGKRRAGFSPALDTAQQGQRAAEEWEIKAENATDPLERELARMMQGMEQRMADMGNVSRIGSTLHALEQIANHSALIPGRKNLIWISGSFPLQIGLNEMDWMTNPGRERRSFWEETQRATRALSNAALAVYPVDARGLVASSVLGADRALSARGPQLTRSLERESQALGDSQATLSVIAERTGGRAYYNRNDLTNAIRSAMEDATINYTLGFYPEDSNMDGKFRALKVAVKRKGLEVRYRNGYFAFPEEEGADEKQRQRALQAAARAPIDSTAIPIYAKLDPDPRYPGFYGGAFHIDAGSMPMRVEKDRWRGSADVVFLMLAEDGRVLKGETQRVDLALNKAQHEQILKQGIVFRRGFDPPKGTIQLRFVVRDATTGLVGSVTVPMDAIKAVAAEPVTPPRASPASPQTPTKSPNP